MKPDDFRFLSGILRERSGLALTEDKSYLLESRLMPLARKRGLAGLDELVAAVRGKAEEALLREITDAMTTNESFFFRDQRPFDQFRQKLLPALLETRGARKHLRIWCAAASMGQEPYTIAMCLMEDAAKRKGWRIEIIGTDIAREVLEKAKAGIYSQFEVQRGLPIQMLVKYFDKVGDLWQVKPELRGMVQYRELNLLRDFRGLGPFDIVFCRNVLIYFDPATKRDVLARIAQIMPADGYLLLGGAETVLGVSEDFKPLASERGVYVLAGRTAH